MQCYAAERRECSLVTQCSAMQSVAQYHAIQYNALQFGCSAIRGNAIQYNELNHPPLVLDGTRPMAPFQHSA
eukprot:7568529-Pyramimonas_sp.AAC.1